MKGPLIEGKDFQTSIGQGEQAQGGSTTKNLVIYNQSLCQWHATNYRLQLSWSYLQLQFGIV